MRKVNFAHIHEQGIDFIVFDADSRTKTNAARSALLARLSSMARQQGLKVDKAALAFEEAGELRFYGTDDLVRFLANDGLPEWTHTLTV